MRNKIIMTALIVVALVVTACASAQPQVGGKPVVAVQPVERTVAGVPAPEAAGGSVADTALPQDTTKQMIIRRAMLELVVSDTEKTVAEVTRIVTGLGGYVSDSNVFRVDGQLQATLTVRVPVKDYENALAQFKGLAVRVQRETTGTENVTMEYTDLNARLKNLELTEKELQELLTEVREKTGKAEDVLAVYNRLAEIRGQIEQIKGRMQYLENLVDMTTISLTLIPDILAKPVVEPGWRPLETLRNALAALVVVLQGLVNVLIYVAVFSLLLIPLIVLILLIRVWQRRRRRAQV